MRKSLDMPVRMLGGTFFASCLLLTFAGPAAAEESAGKEVFLAQKCNLCHGVEGAEIEAKTKSEKLKGPDLTEVAAEYETEWLTKYIKREVQKDGEDHKKEFKGTDEELQAILDWLGSLESAE